MKNPKDRPAESTEHTADGEIEGIFGMWKSHEDERPVEDIVEELRMASRGIGIDCSDSLGGRLMPLTEA